MNRRTFLCGLTLGTLAAPLAGEAQTPRNVPRVGIIYLSGHHHVVVDGLRQGLQELGNVR